ncbi:Uncharacterised protein [Bordetella pertussis]|nr:Uncharacterised protein [Bordetella pertussis]
MPASNWVRSRPTSPWCDTPSARLACSASCARCKASSCVCVLRMATPFSSAVRLGRMVSRPAKRSRSMAVYSCHCGMPATSLAVGGVPCCFAHWASRWLYSASVDCCRRAANSSGRRVCRSSRFCIQTLTSPCSAIDPARSPSSHFTSRLAWLGACSCSCCL